MITTIYFVRHAQPEYENHDDMSRPLSDKGQIDRKRVTEFFCDKHIHAILSSPFKRAMDTVDDLAKTKGLPIQIVQDFRERKVDTKWIDDFDAFCKAQWADFQYKLPGGESLKEVQIRNIQALNNVLKDFGGKNIVIGTHGTALSTIINFYNPSFGYEAYEKIRGLMPWIVKFTFNDDQCLKIQPWKMEDGGW